MNRQFVVKMWDGTKHNISVSPSEGYNDFVTKMEINVELEEGKTFKFISKGKIMNENNFSSFESGFVLALLGTKLKPVETIPPQSSINQNTRSNSTQDPQIQSHQLSDH